MTQGSTAGCSPADLDDMDAFSSRLVTVSILPGWCFGITLEVVTSGEVSDAEVKLDSLLSSSLRCSARLEDGVGGRVA